MFNKKLHQYQHGGISILVLVFGVVFSISIGGLVSVAGLQQTHETRSEIYEQALTVAQAGVEYYRWHLSHDPEDLTGDIGQHQLPHPSGGPDGTFDIEINPPESGSSIITIKSTGWINSHPNIKRTVQVRIGKRSFARFAFLNNSNLWFGTRDDVKGPVFANGGIRMDGTHDSTVESAKETYTCGDETGCDPPETKPGVWGDGGPQELWVYPSSNIDFDSIHVDFADMKNQAQTDGVYLDQSGEWGYHLTFNSDGTFTIKKVTNTKSTNGWSVEEDCRTLYEEIKNEELVGTYDVDDNPIIFIEDTLWVDGVINGKTSVVAARFPIDINNMNIWIPNNLTYLAKDGTSNLGLIAQNDIYFGLDVPQDFEINAAMLAQSGKVIRHNYKKQGCSHEPGAVRQTLTIYGSIVSNLKSYWSYGTGPEIGFGNEPTSGFTFRETIYDPTLYFGPPPYFPTESFYSVISWEEE
ncbi:hypothetical protein ACFL1P_00435 [Patescibacteria group bacterium]